MKEITAIIRMNMVTKTKEALLKAGFPAFTCRKITGRGRKKIDFSLFNTEFEDRLQDKNIAEQISETHRLFARRMLVLLVKEEDTEKVINTIIEVNRTGNPGDGKIFVTNVIDAVRVRTGEKGIDAI